MRGKTTRAKAQAGLYDAARKAAAPDADNQAKEGGLSKKDAAALKASMLANAWMRNCQQELLRDTEVLARGANQFNMFAKDALAGLDSCPAGLDKDASAGVDLATASGAVSGGPKGLVHPDTITFCNALHDAFKCRTSVE